MTELTLILKSSGISFQVSSVSNFWSITENGISDSVVCGIGRNSYFTGTDQKTGFENGKELWDWLDV